MNAPESTKMNNGFPALVPAAYWVNGEYIFFAYLIKDRLSNYQRRCRLKGKGFLNGVLSWFWCMPSCAAGKSRPGVLDRLLNFLGGKCTWFTGIQFCVPFMSPDTITNGFSLTHLNA